MLSPETKRLIYGVAYFLAVVLSGTAISIWSSTLGDSVRLPALVWGTTWLIEFFLFTDVSPHHRRDWLAHIGGICVSILWVTVWLVLRKRYPPLLNPNIQIICSLFINLFQMGAIYSLSSPGYRKTVFK